MAQLNRGARSLVGVSVSAVARMLGATRAEIDELERDGVGECPPGAPVTHIVRLYALFGEMLEESEAYRRAMRAASAVTKD